MDKGQVKEKKTAAQILRDAANYGYENVECSICKEVNGGICLNDGRCSCDRFERDSLRKLADMVEAEKRAIREAQAGSAHHTMKTWAKGKGYGWKDGESITQWLDRNFIPWPLNEDGEPLQFGGATEDCEHIDRISFTRGGFYFNSRHRDDLKKYRYGDRVKRPAPKYLDSGGVPIEEGDTVWIVPGEWCDKAPLYGFKAWDKCTVRYLKESNIGPRVCVAADDDMGFASPCQLTHQRPDSWERLEEDAKKTTQAYWECRGSYCSNCPAKEKGKSPRERYGADGCYEARSLDLIARAKKLAGVER